MYIGIYFLTLKLVTRWFTLDRFHCTLLCLIECERPCKYNKDHVHFFCKYIHLYNDFKLDIYIFSDFYLYYKVIMTHGPDPVYVLRGSQSTITYLKYLSNDVLYSGDQDGFIYIWDMKSNRQITKMTAHPGYSVLWIDFVNEDETMVTQGRDGIVQFWSKDCDQWTKSGKLYVKSGFWRKILSK